MNYEGPYFDLICVGTGLVSILSRLYDYLIDLFRGGPDESNLSAYLFKPFDKTWDEGSVAIDAG